MVGTSLNEEKIKPVSDRTRTRTVIVGFPNFLLVPNLFSRQFSPSNSTFHVGCIFQFDNENTDHPRAKDEHKKNTLQARSLTIVNLIFQLQVSPGPIGFHPRAATQPTASLPANRPTGGSSLRVLSHRRECNATGRPRCRVRCERSRASVLEADDESGKLIAQAGGVRVICYD